MGRVGFPLEFIAILTIGFSRTVGVYYQFSENTDGYMFAGL